MRLRLGFPETDARVRICVQMISLKSVPRRKIVGAGEGRPGQEKSPARV